MKSSTLSALGAMFAGMALAHPVGPAARDGSTQGNSSSSLSEGDITILQFALTLELLENTFYQEAFASFQVQHFLDAGFDEAFFENLQFIAADEAAHVQFLNSTISSAGVAPVQACQYSFPVTDVASFVTLSAVVENVGTSAYLGAAPFVDSKEILAAAASIMATEALHTSAQRESLGAIAAPNSFQTPLDPNSVFTIASEFIVSCPPSNPPLPFTAFPGLSVNTQQCFQESGGSSASCFPPAAGSSIRLIPNFAQSHGVDFSQIGAIFVTILSGLDVVSIQAAFGNDGSINASIPSSIAGGQVYIFITTTDMSGQTFSDAQVLFGPAIFELAPSLGAISQ